MHNLFLAIVLFYIYYVNNKETIKDNKKPNYNIKPYHILFNLSKNNNKNAKFTNLILETKNKRRNLNASSDEGVDTSYVITDTSYGITDTSYGITDTSYFITDTSYGITDLIKENKKGNGYTNDGHYFDFDEKITNITKDRIRDNRLEIMNKTIPGEIYNLKGDGYELKIAPMGVKEEGKTSIDFLSCENKLREHYVLNQSDILTVFQTEMETTNKNSLTNKVQYIVYDGKTQLDFSFCSGEQILINYTLKNDSYFNKTMYTNFLEKGIDIFNSSDLFFNDICYSYSDGGSDMILSDRISEIYQKLFFM